MIIGTVLRPLVLFPALLLGSPALAAGTADQVNPKLDPRLDRMVREAVASGIADAAGERAIDVIVTGRLDRSVFSRLGIAPGTVFPGVATLRVPLERVEALAELPEVTRVHAPQSMEMLMDATATEADVVDVWGGPAPEFGAGGHRGAGVIVGVIDTGFDIAHQDFRNAAGGTRVRYIWDQAMGQEPPPGDFGYGQEWTAAEIDAGEAWIVQDVPGHGTHITGVAAGNGQATGNGQPAYKYVGMAPEADLVLVRVSSVTDALVIDAMSYIDRRASELGKDAVILIALGKRTGPHDGSDPLDVAVDAISGPGRIVVAGTGNEAKLKKHASAAVSGTGQTGTVTFTVPSYTPTGSNSLDIDGWTNAGRSFSVRVVTPAGHTLGPIPVQEQYGSANTPNGYFYVHMPPATGPGQQIHFWVDTPASGTWRFEIIGGSAPPGDVHFWMGDTFLAGASPVFATGLSTAVTIMSPATATQAIAVNAYTVKKYWYDQNNGLKFYPSAVIGKIADFASLGPRRDGVIKPDIAASGYGVAAARSAQASVFAADIVQDGVHRMMTGTSVSAATVAGAVALLLEEFPGLDPASVKAILAARSVQDTHTGDTPNATWGIGKLCLTPVATTGIAGGNTVAAGFALGAAFPNPVRRLTRVPVEVAQASPVTIAVYDVGGRTVRQVHDGVLEPGSYEFTWDGTDHSGRVVASGRYYIVASDAGARRSRALTVIR